VKCPSCSSQKIYRDGLRPLATGETVQRFLCRSCGHRFSESSKKLNVSGKLFATANTRENHHQVRITTRKAAFQEASNDLPFFAGEDIGSHNLTTVEKQLNTLPYSNSKYRVCATPRGAKNLEEIMGKTTTDAGTSQTSQQNIKGKLVEFSFHMKKEGLTEATIATFTCLLKKLEKNGANLLEPESVKEVLANIKASPNSKATIKGAYGCFLKFLGKTWKAPKWQYQPKIPFIPLESEIDQLIAGCAKNTAAILQTLKETGMRIGEASKLKWIDMNVENNTIILNEPEKNSNPRIFRVSPKLVGILQTLPKKCDRIFGKGSVRDKQWIFTLQRKRLAVKLGNPRLAQITFHTLRHWKGTMEYHKTHDPWHVKSLLGHKSLKSTEIYINVEQAIFNDADDEFHVKVAANLEEACKLLEVGFEYVTDMDGKKLFRKRK